MSRGGRNGANVLGWAFRLMGYLGYKKLSASVRGKSRKSNVGRPLEWWTQRDLNSQPLRSKFSTLPETA
jgi:hypothetical protein